MRQFVRFLLAVALACGLAACVGSAPPVPRDHFYRLLVPAPPSQGGQVAYPGVVVVESFEADGLLRERPLLYSASGAAHEVQQHDYHHWSDPPTNLVRDQLVGYLRASGLAEVVVTPDLRLRADYEVSGKIRRLERLLAGGPPRVVVELELAFLRLADQQVVVIDSYTAERPAADAGVDSSVIALNRALAEAFEGFLQDLARGRRQRAAGS